MLRKLLNRLFGPFSPGSVIPLGEFLILLQKSYAYLRKHHYRVLSTELPDDLLKKWLMPGEKQAEEYKRSFARQNDTLSQTQLPVFVFDHVLQKRFNRDISTFDDAEMEIAGRDLRVYILLLNYIFGMREAGRPLIEFDIFDVGNYDAIIERIEAQETNPNPPTA
ncbi:hypothetical protein SAMN05444145_11410 [Alistipes timonensis JC136]|uniref:Uncharacterized protein n=1 Tax=Alistipes timonensis JC136 TaxID=1033731 RepID=A0A1H4FY30_9BACT|nr:hypothetical protein [Alistipes timonensis]SEB02256.1 hypothetical protein SAMN05444145_11410 [Alistipes timonensis JC136]